MSNFKRKKPKKYSKVYRGGVDGPDCGYCGSNWTFTKNMKTWLIQWELNNEYMASS